MVNIENLGDNVKKKSEEMTFWGNTEVMEAEKELSTLEDPISLLQPVKSVPYVIDLLPTIPEEQSVLGPRPDISLLMDWVVNPMSARFKMVQDLQAVQD